MPHIRTIKPSFFTDWKIGQLDPLDRILFQGLWCHADREGRLKDEPVELKVQILPYDNEYSIDAGLSALHDYGVIIRYESDGDNYIQITNFEEHQRPHHTEADSVIPVHDSPIANGDADSGRLRTKERKGREGKGKSRTRKLANRESVISWDIPDELNSLELYRMDKKLCGNWSKLFPLWKQTYLGLDVLVEVRKAHVWEISNPSKRKKDRPRFLTGWLNRANDRYRPPSDTPASAPQQPTTPDHIAKKRGDDAMRIREAKKEGA